MLQLARSANEVMSNMDFMWQVLELNKQSVSMSLIDLIAHRHPSTLQGCQHQFSLHLISNDRDVHDLTLRIMRLQSLVPRDRRSLCIPT